MEIVKDPIDLRTIMERLTQADTPYTKAEDVFTDIDRMWTNSYEFNQDDKVH